MGLERVVSQKEVKIILEKERERVLVQLKSQLF